MPDNQFNIYIRCWEISPKCIETIVQVSFHFGEETERHLSWTISLCMSGTKTKKVFLEKDNGRNMNVFLQVKQRQKSFCLQNRLYFGSRADFRIEQTQSLLCATNASDHGDNTTPCLSRCVQIIRTAHMQRPGAAGESPYCACVHVSECWKRGDFRQKRAVLF